jgi:tetratricopeptide (TPR) repeat protein
MHLKVLVKKAEEYASEDIWTHDAAVINQQIIKHGQSSFVTDAYLRLAKCYYRNGFLKGAIKYFQRVLSLDHDNLEARDCLRLINLKISNLRDKESKRLHKTNLQNDTFKMNNTSAHPNSKSCPVCGGTGSASSDSSLRNPKRYLDSMSLCKTCGGKGWLGLLKTDSTYE